MNTYRNVIYSDNAIWAHNIFNGKESILVMRNLSPENVLKCIKTMFIKSAEHDSTICLRRTYMEDMNKCDNRKDIVAHVLTSVSSLQFTYSHTDSNGVKKYSLTKASSRIPKIEICVEAVLLDEIKFLDRLDLIAPDEFPDDIIVGKKTMLTGNTYTIDISKKG